MAETEYDPCEFFRRMAAVGDGISVQTFPDRLVGAHSKNVLETDRHGAYGEMPGVKRVDRRWRWNDRGQSDEQARGGCTGRYVAGGRCQAVLRDHRRHR